MIAKEPYDPTRPKAPAYVLRVVLSYAAFAGLWILLSDNVVGWLFSDPARITLISTLKGWLFVLVTSALLYALIRRLLEQALAGSRQELAAQAEKARALQMLAAIAEHSSDAIYSKDLEGRYLLVNPSVERIVGKSAQQMLGQDDTALFPQQAATIRANDSRVMTENRTETYEETLATAQGERTFLATKGPLHDEQGQVTGMFGISRDITARHQADVAAHQQALALQQRNEELDHFNRIAVDRELAMIKLKQQVNALSSELGRSPPFALDFAEAPAAEGSAHRSIR